MNTKARYISGIFVLLAISALCQTQTIPPPPNTPGTPLPILTPTPTTTPTNMPANPYNNPAPATIMPTTPPMLQQPAPIPVPPTTISQPIQSSPDTTKPHKKTNYHLF